MSKNDKVTFWSDDGSLYHLFLDSELIEMIKHIQKNEKLKNEGEVITHLIRNYVKKDIPQLDQLEHDISQTSFDGNRYPPSRVIADALKFDGTVQFQKLEKILASTKSENVIKKLPQHKIYGLSGAAMIHRFHTKILPVKFSLMCLSKMIVDTDNPWISLTELKTYTLNSAKIFIKKFNSSPIHGKFKVNTGFPIDEPDMVSGSEDNYLSYARSSRRFTEQFVGRKLQKHETVQIAGAIHEMGLIKAKTLTFNEEEKTGGSRDTRFGKIYVTLSENGKEFVSYKNDLIDFVYNSEKSKPDSIFSQQEREFYFKKILPEYKFENDFVRRLMEDEQIDHTKDIKKKFKKQFLEFCNSEFPTYIIFPNCKHCNADNYKIKIPSIDLQDDIVKMYSNTIMNRLIEFDVFTKKRKSKSGPYTRMENVDFINH